MPCSKDSDSVDLGICLTNNRTSSTRELFCNCQEEYPNFFFINTKTKKRIPFHCKTWHCEVCYDKNRRKLKNKIIQIATMKKMKFFITLTFDHKLCTAEESYDYIGNCWKKFLTIIHRKLKYTKFDYIKVLESHKSGYAHIHFITNKRFDAHQLREQWKRLGGGAQMRIEPVNVKKIANYLSKYMTKDSMKLPKGRRHYSMARHLNALLEKPEKTGEYKLAIELYIGGWKVIREVCRNDFAWNYIYLKEIRRWENRTNFIDNKKINTI